jgi:CheY-like chemotaxis protein
MPPTDKTETYKALVVDDEPTSRNFTKEALLRNNLVVEEAEDGQIALEKCAQHYYDIVFMDIEMPNLNGYDSTKAIRSLDNTSRDTYIIAVSGHADTAEQAIACFQAGMNDIMTKPFSLSLLRNTLKKWLEKIEE